MTAGRTNGQTLRWAAGIVAAAALIVAAALAFGRVEARADRNADELRRHAERLEMLETLQRQTADGVADIRGNMQLLLRQRETDRR